MSIMRKAEKQLREEINKIDCQGALRTIAVINIILLRKYSQKQIESMTLSQSIKRAKQIITQFIA